jgi:hypothetical protein
MHPLRVYLRAYARRKHVRPWAISAPIVVLLIVLPLLRPLRHPLISQMSDDETARWGTVAALVEHQTFALDATPFATTGRRVRVGDAWYANQPPVMGLLLAGPYWLIRRCGLTFTNNPSLVEYLLTLLGVALPVAAAAGTLYRLNRLFELTRPWRAGLALAVVLGSGLVSYATVLNPYAPAAALVLLASAILMQVSLVKSPVHSALYLVAAGFFAALAAAIDPAAIVFTILLVSVILCLRWRWSLRLGGVLLYGIGLLPPAMLHVSLSVPITGDWRLGLAALAAPRAPAPRHRAISGAPATVPAPPAAPAVRPPIAGPVDDDDGTDEAEDQPLLLAPTMAQRVEIFAGRFCAALVGSHGLLTHFPVLVFGVVGLDVVLRRHWPITAKSLAIVTAAGAIIITCRYVALPLDWRWAMFAVRWYVVFLPLTLFWAGAWIRRHHSPLVWSIAGVLLAFSVTVSLIGATDPMPRAGYDRYSLAGAMHNLISPAAETPVLAGR